MSVTRENQKYMVRVDYRESYDLSGQLGLGNYSQTFTKVKETATNEQLLNFAIALMSLTVYNGAPFKVKLIDTSDLIVE